MKTRYLLIIAFTACISFSKTEAQDTNWVKNNTWYFDNFVKDTLSWAIFREAFIGVAPAPAADFDQLFYTYLFRDQLASKGHCYGMDVMAMLMKKNGGHLGYCHPPYMYSGSYASNTNPDGMPSNDTVGPTDRTLRTAIEIVHGIQINHGFLSFLLDIIAKHKNRDGRYAFQQVDEYLAKDDQPIISITLDLSPQKGGHVLIPYYTESGGGTKKIYVYDPNRTWYRDGATGHDWYTSRSNYIEINSGSGAWTYTMCCDTVWAGDPGSGGNLLVIPLSIAGKKDRVPQSLLADGSYAINTVMIWGNVNIEQISETKGTRKYFKDDGTGIETTPGKSLDNILPFIPMDGAGPSKGSSKAATYFFRGSDPVTFRYKAYGNYRIGMMFHGKYYEIKGTGKGTTQEFSPEAKYLTPVRQRQPE
ncbi:MAG: hypothetical protein U0U70_11375 [Chitinophagaceae bacterium]